MHQQPNQNAILQMKPSSNRNSSQTNLSPKVSFIELQLQIAG